MYDCEHRNSNQSAHIRKIFKSGLYLSLFQKRQEMFKVCKISATEWRVRAENAEVTIQLHGWLAKLWRWKKLRAGDVLKVTPFVTELVPEQRGSHTSFSLPGEPTTTTSRSYCSVPTVSVPATEHFQTTTVKHLERLSRRKKHRKNHTIKIYSRNVFPKLTLHSQNFWERPKAVSGTFAS